MIKRIFLGKHKSNFNFNNDLFFSIYRNDLFEEDLNKKINNENKELFSFKTAEIIRNNESVKNIIKNTLKKYIENTSFKNKSIDSTFIIRWFN